MHTSGLHHVTVISSDPQRNRDFYEGVLGLRLVKQTVNFDDPGTLHLYYGDGLGSPGTILTFFPIPGLTPGAAGAAVTERIALAVPPGAIAAWRERLAAAGIASADGAAGLVVRDPDGLALELVESGEIIAAAPWTARTDPAMAVQGVAGVHLASVAATSTARVLGDWLGLADHGAGVFRASEALGGTVAVRDAAADPHTRRGAGIVHHIAFRAAGREAQLQWLDHLRRQGAVPTPVQDREYFTSIYFREPGGVLLEIATDGPGFARDEAVDALGARLCLPPWFEQHRALLDEHLPRLEPAPAMGARA
jgi:glyoxalase family protein